MWAVIFLIVSVLSGAAYAHEASSIYIPIERTLWRVSSDGSASRQSFQFEGGSLGSGTESKVSPDRQFIAFDHAGNLWTLAPASEKCTQISGFGGCDPEASGCYGITLYGWTPDGSNLVFSTSYVDYGPGEGEPPQKFDGLKDCRSTATVSGFELPEADESGESSVQSFLIEVVTGKLRRIKPEEQPLAFVLSDGADGNAVKSPSGKLEASIRDPYQGKSELVVGGNPVLPGIKVRRFWWITNNAIAALSYSHDQKSLELRVVAVPKSKVLGLYTQAKK